MCITRLSNELYSLFIDHFEMLKPNKLDFGISIGYYTKVKKLG